MKQKPIIEKLLYVCMAMFILMTICAYVAFLSGSTYFLIDTTEISNNFILDGILSCLMFSINLYLWIGFCVDIKPVKVLYATILYIPIWFLLNLIFSNKYLGMISYIVPILFIFLLAIYSKDNLKKVIIRQLIMLLVVSTYQVMTYQYKCELMTYVISPNIRLSSKILMQIDLIAVWLLMYLIRRCKNNEYFKFPLGMECNVVSKESSWKIYEDDEDVEKFNNLNHFQKFRVMLVYYSIQILQLFIVASVCAIGKVWIEAIIIFVSFFIFRIILNKSWHSDSLVICTLASTLVFYGSSKMSVPFAKSLFSPILIGMFVAIALYKIATHEDYVEELSLRINSLKNNIEELKSELKGESKLTIKEQEIFELLKQGIPQVDIGEMLEPPISERTVRRYKRKIEEKLQIKI